VRKLRQLVADLRRGESFQVTRLTVLKGLCGEPALANLAFHDESRWR
jgi:hypothetical protein